VKSIGTALPERGLRGFLPQSKRDLLINWKDLSTSALDPHQEGKSGRNPEIARNACSCQISPAKPED
jgi:hypothetical protein